MKNGLYLLGLAVIIAILGGSNGFVPQAEAEAKCFIRFNFFDSKIHDVGVAEATLIKDGLINKGDLANAVQDGKLPFDSNGNDSKLINTALDNLEIDLCGKVDGCDVKTLDTAIICQLGTEPTGSTISDAQSTYNSRIAGMNTCQRQIFKDIEAINSQYLKDVRTANTRYYQQLAPRTAALLKSYRLAKDNKEKSSILEDYVSHNTGLRQDLYEEQATLFNKFIGSRATLQNDFNSCK